MVNSITNNPDSKHVSFSSPLHSSTPTKKMPKKKTPKKSLLKHHQHQNKAFQDHGSALQDHNMPKVKSLPMENHSLQDHSTNTTTKVTSMPIENHSLQDNGSNITVKDVQDIGCLSKLCSPSHLTLQATGVECTQSALTPLSPQYSMQDVRSPLSVWKPLKTPSGYGQLRHYHPSH